MTTPRLFLIGCMDAKDHAYLDDYLDWYINHLGIAPANTIIGVLNDPMDTNTPLMRCNDVLERYQIPRWSELPRDTDIVSWRCNEQDTYVQDEDWVLHANAGDFIDCGWSGGDPRYLIEWMDQHEFDCVHGEVVEHYARGHLPIGRSPWELYPDWHYPGKRRVALARGYWYTCDDGDLCPQFEASAWTFPRALLIHRFTYKVWLDVDTGSDGNHE